MRWMVLAVALAACRGADGDGGGAVVGVDDTDPGGEASGLVWVDAEGRVVDGVVYLGSQLSYVDDNGHAWALDPWTGELSGATADVVYADPGCQNEPWFREVLMPLGTVMQTNDLGEDVRYFSAPAGADLTALDPAYCWEASGSGVYRAIAVAELAELARPSATWAAPLHAEYR